MTRGLQNASHLLRRGVRSMTAAELCLASSGVTWAMNKESLTMLLSASPAWKPRPMMRTMHLRTKLPSTQREAGMLPCRDMDATWRERMQRGSTQTAVCYWRHLGLRDCMAGPVPRQSAAPVIQLRQRDALRHEALDLLLIFKQLRAQALHRHPLPAQHVLLDRRKASLAQAALADLQASITTSDPSRHASASSGPFNMRCRDGGQSGAGCSCWATACSCHREKVFTAGFVDVSSSHARTGDISSGRMNRLADFMLMRWNCRITCSSGTLTHQQIARSSTSRNPFTCPRLWPLVLTGSDSPEKPLEDVVAPVPVQRRPAHHEMAAPVQSRPCGCARPPRTGELGSTVTPASSPNDSCVVAIDMAGVDSVMLANGDSTTLPGGHRAAAATMSDAESTVSKAGLRWSS